MIYVRVELWPKGARSRAVVLGEATIENRGGTPTRCKYSARFSRKGGFRDVFHGASHRESVVEGFPRKELGGWDLLLRALSGAFGDRNP